MREAEVRDAVAEIAGHPGLAFAGLHNHVGFPAYDLPYTGELDLQRHRRAAEQTLELAADLPGCRIVNLGGGFRVPKDHGFGPGGLTDIPPVEAYADTIGGAVVASGLDVELLLEAGGYLVADAVTLLATVLQRKAAIDDGPDWVIVRDASAYHYVRALMYGFRHHAVAPGRLDEPPVERVRLAGPVCTTDTLAEAELPHLDASDLVAIVDQGAYCESVTSDYCAIPIPAAVLASRGRAALVRHRETVEDLVARFDVPDWLD
jgi:diaminopimelate decarboxylase